MARPLVREFIRESNRIESIIRDPYEDECLAHELFLSLEEIEIVSLKNLVQVLQPGAVLRNKTGLDVFVGNHVPPPGGSAIELQLQMLLDEIHAGRHTPWSAHVRYEKLHPFTDGNGRSGRALWAWMMYKQFGVYGLSRGFLHEFYYQTLEAMDKHEV